MVTFIAAKAMKAYKLSEGKLHKFLNSAINGSGQLHGPAALSLERSTRNPLNTILGSLRSLCGRFGEDKVSFPCRDSNLRISTAMPAPVLTLLVFTTLNSTKQWKVRSINVGVRLLVNMTWNLELRKEHRLGCSRRGYWRRHLGRTDVRRQKTA
jgi:hypothetical protein